MKDSLRTGISFGLTSAVITAIIVNFAWGLSSLAALSYFLAKFLAMHSWKIILIAQLEMED